jgi:hypothetical protein
MIHDGGAPVHIFDAGEKNSPGEALPVYETASNLPRRWPSLR